MTLERKPAKKSARRVQIIDALVNGMTHHRTVKGLGFHSKSESHIATAMYVFLNEELEKIHRTLTPGLRSATIARKAEKSLLWEGSPSTTINMITVFGTQHRPDFIVQFNDFRIAIELKRGESGASVREGLGQGIVYSQVYDFVIFLFVDTSTDKKVERGAEGPGEQQLTRMLWDHHNIRFVVL